MSSHYSYDNVVSLSEQEFRERAVPEKDLKDPEKFTKSTPEELLVLENLLDLKAGVLKNEEFYIQKGTCPNGHPITMKDFVLTAIVDAKHDKSMMIQTFLGNKYILNKGRAIRCFECGVLILKGDYSYNMGNYACSTTHQN